MLNFKLLDVCLFVFLNFSFLCAETVSVIIPCHPKHAQYLPQLLQYFCSQTILPEEIVISLSEADKCDQNIISTIKQTNYPFVVNLICTNEKKYAGPNRNIACQHARGDIFITHDADDIPHVQRIEILKYVFSNYDVDQIIHLWIPDSSRHSKEHMSQFYWGNYIPSKIDLYFLNQWDDFYKTDYTTMGCTAIRRHVIDRVKWIDTPHIGEDLVFCRETFNTFHKTCVIKANLLIYGLH